MTSTRTKNKIIVTAVTCLLAACGGGGAPGQNASTEPPPVVTAPPTGATVDIRGRSTKGPVAGAQIALFEVDTTGRATGPAVATTTTDAAGNWTATVPADHTGLLVKSSGGAFVDESDPDPTAPRTITLTDDDTLLSFLPPGETAASVTLVSNALLRKAQLEVDADNFTDRLTTNRAQYVNVMGLDPLVTVAANPLAPTGTPDEQRYALIAGGLAYALNALAVEQSQTVADFATIQQVIEDLLDCRLDGLGLGGQTLYDVAAFDGRTLNDEILRFRNNHADAYVGVALPTIDASGCQPSPGSIDSVAPNFVTTADPLELAAVDANGTPTSAPALVEAVAAFTVSDDRDESVRVDIALPEILPLGVNDIDVVAQDGWGNVTRLTWRVTVRDLDPPVLQAPPPVQVDASDVRTPVELGSAEVSDNVTDVVALTNDAPVEGFLVGDTDVTWRAVDAAGLATEAVQRVTVIGAAPSVAATISPPAAAVGGEIDLDLSGFFSDPFSAPLTFALSGLPEGSGLVFAPMTGRLTGTPTLADLNASPLALTITASNGQFEQAADFELNIAPRVPNFVLSATELTVNEDFASVRAVEIEPLVPIPPEILEFDATVDPPVATAQVSMDGTVDLIAQPDSFGNATLTVTARNVANNVEASQSVALAVTPVNDAPIVQQPLQDLQVTVGRDVQMALADYFNDVDDVSLGYTVENLPLSLQLDDNGMLSGTPTEIDALAQSYPVTVVARDGEGLSASAMFALTLFVPDADGDGLSDEREAQIGSDPGLPDTDGDGVNDALEVRAGSDPLVPAVTVRFVAPGGDNGNAGTGLSQALRDSDGVAQLPPGLSDEQPTFVLYAPSGEPYGGTLRLRPPCNNIVVAGSLARGVTLSSATGTAIDMAGCNNVKLVGLTITDNAQRALDATASVVSLDTVTLTGNASSGDGGAARFTNSIVRLDNVHAANNVSGGNGGAIAVQGGTLAADHSQFHGNVAASMGGALFVRSPRARSYVSNGLFAFNVAATGSAVAMGGSGDTRISNATIAYQRASLGGAAVERAGSATVVVRDSVVVGNHDELGQPANYGVGVDAQFTTGDEPLGGVWDVVLPTHTNDFAAQYIVDDAASVRDNGSLDAAISGVAGRFVENGSVYPDSGLVDRGFHYRRRPLALADGELTVDASAIETATGRALLLVPRMDGRAVGSGRRVRAEAPANVAALTPVGALVDGRVGALDLGNGSYLVYAPNVGSDVALQVWVDQRTAELVVSP